ncbi:hypothetical protein SprV_0301007000 [Sparganum proliferum]
MSSHRLRADNEIYQTTAILKSLAATPFFEFDTTGGCLFFISAAHLELVRFRRSTQDEVKDCCLRKTALTRGRSTKQFITHLPPPQLPRGHDASQAAR